MPCSDGYTNDPDLYERLNVATQAACELARFLRGMSKGGWEAVSKKTRHWVEHHDRMDVARIAREKREKRRQHVKKQALKKLSRAEREALGL